MKRTFLRIAALVAALVMASQAFGQAAGLVDSRGKELGLAAKAKRVISLSPAMTEILYAAGAGQAVVGVTSYCNYPPEADALPEVGGFSPNTVSLEKIVSLKPDLVVGELSAHARLAEQFEKAGIRFAAIDLGSFEGIFSAMIFAGRAAGKEALAEQTVSSLKSRLAVIKIKTGSVPEAKRPLIFWEVWNEPLMTAGPKTFISQIIVAGGGRNVFGDLAEDWPSVSFEALVTRKPDWLMASKTHATNVTPEKLAARPGWGSLPMVKDKRLGLFDGDIVSRPGPRFVEAVELVAKTLYPELF